MVRKWGMLSRMEATCDFKDHKSPKNASIVRFFDKKKFLNCGTFALAMHHQTLASRPKTMTRGIPMFEPLQFTVSNVRKVQA